MCTANWSLKTNISLQVSVVAGVPNSAPILDWLNASVVNLPNLRAKELTQGVANCTSDTTSIQSFWELMLSGSDFETTSFMDPNALMASAEAVNCAMSAQLARQYFMSPLETMTTGTTNTVQTKLITSKPTFTLTEIVLLLLCLITSSLLVIAPRMACVSRDRRSIGGISTILARSQSFVRGYWRYGRED